MLLADWAENSNVFAANREPERARPLGTTLEKHLPQGAFPFALDFSSPKFFVRPFRLSPAPLSALRSPRMSETELYYIIAK